MRRNAAAYTVATVYTELCLLGRPVLACELARRLNVAPSTISSAVRQLEARGAVRRSRRTRTSWWIEVRKDT